MTKKRKSLDDSLASEFVFGGNEPAVEETTSEVEEVKAVEKASTPNAPIEPKSDEKLSTSSSLMEKLQVEAKEGTKRFTIDLRESVHRKLSILSAKTGRTKADIVRLLLDDALKDIDE
ncbi:MAG: hypothetical protein WBM44_02070 [Waterburya sp.]